MSTFTCPAPLRALALATALALGAAASASAATERFEIGFSNIYSVGLLDDPDNTTLSFDIGRQSFVVGFDFDVQLTAFDPSWLDEMTLKVSNDIGEGFTFRPIFDLSAPGTASASGSFDLLNAGLAFSTRRSGTLNLEFFEFWDDFAGQADGRWDRGTLGVIYAPIPEPATLAMFAAGVAVVVGRRRLGSRR